MANDIITLEAANLFCGDHDPSAENSNHLTIQNLKLPGLEENNSDHTAGGVIGASFTVTPDQPAGA
jgi:hypothetical protein